MHNKLISLVIFIFTTCMTIVAGAAQTGPGAASPAASDRAVREIGLDECLETALRNNHRRPASKFAVAMAEAQHKQALAGYWPQLSLKGGYQRLDEAPNFIFPATAIRVPAGTANITIPPGVLGPGPVTLPVSTPAQSIDVPKQDIKLMDPDVFMTSAHATWLLYDGGMRKGYREQSKGWLDMMRQEERRTDLEITDSVKRFYYGAVLARQLRQVGQDTLARMEATLNLTEAMYKEGSGKVKKTDFLDNKVMVETLRATLALLEKNEEMARAALANTMGLSWDESVRPAAAEIPFNAYPGDLERLVGSSYQFSPDWGKLEAGLRAAEGAVRTAKSGHHPKLALTGELHKWWNDYNDGMATDENKEGWSVGAGVEIPIFDGFLTTHRIGEANARLSRLKEEKFLLKEGLGLQIKDIFLSINAAQKSHQATLDAMKSATENRELNIRAYQNELVDTEKVIRAQLVEALMSAQHYKTRYDHVALQSQMNLVVGTEILKQIEK